MRRILALLLAAAPWLYSAAVLVVGLFLRDYRCGDSCSVRDDDWRRYEDATEWDLMPWIGAGLLALGTIFLVCVWLGRRWLAVAALCLGTAATIAFVSWLSPGWHEHVADHPTLPLLSVATFAAGVAAAFLGTRTRARTD